MFRCFQTPFNCSSGSIGKIVFILLFLTIFEKTISAQPCNCKHTITNQQFAVNGNNLNIQPGDTICILAGTREYLYLTNFHGDSLHYLVIINCGGSVIVESTDHPYGIKIMDSEYFRLTGSGTDSIKYGIKVMGTATGSGVTLGGKSTNFEIDHLEVANTGFAGIMSKTDPTCDLSSNRGYFTQHNTIFHDNYIHNTGGEGFYVGHSFYTGYPTTCNNQPDTLYPHEIKGLRIYHNIVLNAHWDGIQVGCATEDCEIYGNSIIGYGLDAYIYQTNGIQIGAGTTGKCFNNFISNGNGNGIAVFGTGNNYIFNNIIFKAGLNYFPADPTKRVYGIFCDDRATVPGRSFNFVNNTIVNVKTDGIRFYSLESVNNQFVNNIIIHPGSLGSYSTNASSYIFLSSGVSATLSNNFTDPSMTNVHFRDTLSGNFRLLGDSPARDTGADFSLMGVTFDNDSLPRPYLPAFDIGAFEYHPENTWTGVISSSWNVAGNWSKAGVPLHDENVIIPAGTPHPLQMISPGNICNDLLICSGSQLVLDPTAAVTISGNLTIQVGGSLYNQGTLTIKGLLINQNP